MPSNKAMETFRVEGFPADSATVHVAFFRLVENSGALRTRLISAASASGPESDAERDALDFAFIDADLLLSRQHLLAAIYQALLASAHGRLRTKTIHSEILLALSPASNISEAIKLFGISPSSKSVLIVRIRQRAAGSLDDASILLHILELVDGKLVSMDDLGTDLDWSRMRKVYKLHDLPTMDGWGEEARRKEIEPILIGAVATKTVAA